MTRALYTSVPCLVALGCLGDVEVPPEPPKLVAVESPTRVAEQTLRGTKPKGTAVHKDGEVVVPHDDAESFMLAVTLDPGDNHFVLTTSRPSGLVSRKETAVDILYEPLCPSTPTLVPVPAVTRDLQVTLRGTKAKRTAIYVGNNEIVPLDDATEYSHVLALPPVDGRFAFVLTARDAKGQASDPIDFVITRDTTPPTIATRYPLPGETGIATNSEIWIGFFEPLLFATAIPEAGTVTLEGPAGAITGLATYHAEAGTLLFSTQSLPANATLTVRVDPTKLGDLAGNAADPGQGPWTWTFDTGSADDPASPPAPVLSPPPAQVTTPAVTLSGTKTANTGIRVGGRLVVALGPATSWQYELPLIVGTSSVVIASVGANDRSTALPPVTIERREEKPAAPTVNAPPASVSEPRVTLSGSKPADTSLLLDGRPVVCRGPETSWSLAVDLSPGLNELRFETQDGAGARSEPAIVRISYERMFAGLVPEGFKLRVELGLRDLANVAGIRDEFETGPNNYGLDVWLEGPVEAADTCVITNGHRQDIRYVATIEHYIGAKEQHKVPFADVDYRGTDYLASLITGGVFNFRGLGPASMRRDPAGRELTGLMAGVTEQDLRQNIDCLGQVGVDVCTSATTRHGRKVIGPWTPRKRGSPGLLDQGEYLLHILINLDRNGSWLSANDYETCWGDPTMSERGMHRVVRRVALGGDPYTIVVPQSEEQFGPDREGGGRLHFVESDGVTITWGP